MRLASENYWTIALLFLCIVSLYFFSIDVYSLNRGFSFLDEAYYLVSYKMAAEGYYPHYNNTPFLVAFFFERFEPGLLGYRVTHLAMMIGIAGLFFFSIKNFFRLAGISLNFYSTVCLYLLGFLGALYSFKTSVATLSYNHINEFLALGSESLLLLSFSSDMKQMTKLILIFISGLIAALDIYIKPTTFIVLLFVETAFIYLFFTDKRQAGIHIGIFLLGCISSLIWSILTFYPLIQWEQYLTFMQKQQSHQPVKVLMSFASSAFDMLKNCTGFIISGCILIFYNCINVHIKKSTKLSIIVISLLSIMNSYFMIRLLFPSTIWGSFHVHWWYWWVYSSTLYVSFTLLNLILGLAVVFSVKNINRKWLALILLLLTFNPVLLSIGTLNGLGQIQMHLPSWLLLNGIVLCLCLKASNKLSQIYASILLAIFVSIAAIYFTRQIYPGNFSGNNSFFAQNCSLKKLGGPLKNILVDKETYDLLLNTKKILDRYPSLPILNFFDMPGFLYPFGHPWVISVPWLTDYKYPLTKDDVYNCKMITEHPEKLSQTIFIVSNEKDISPQLLNCLAKIGYPKKLKLLESIKTTDGGADDFIKFYLHS